MKNILNVCCWIIWRVLLSKTKLKIKINSLLVIELNWIIINNFESVSYFWSSMKQQVFQWYTKKSIANEQCSDTLGSIFEQMISLFLPFLKKTSKPSLCLETRLLSKHLCRANSMCFQRLWSRERGEKEILRALQDVFHLAMLPAP